MNKFRLILQTFRHYPFSGLMTAAGIAIATAVICGALIIGDSLSKSLENIVDYRLGETTHSLTAGERLFSRDLAARLNNETGIFAAPVLKSEGILSVQEKNIRLNNIQVWGIDSLFTAIVGSEEKFNIKAGEILISDNLANRLNLVAGDEVLLRLRTINPIPPNTPFVSDEGQTITRRVRIAGIVDKENGGHYNLQVSQTTPFNIFANLDWLNRIMSLDGKVNAILLKASQNEDIQKQVMLKLSPEDLGLKITQNDNDWIITSDRVFMDDYLSENLLKTFPEAKPSLTYFANGLTHGKTTTPYSFIAATNHVKSIQKKDDMAINRWLADDLGVAPGDSIEMEYFVVGLLRELQVHKAKFRIVEIISMEQASTDQVLMPHLPGLTDAGSCRDWNTGVPINLENIRKKDEDYWSDYRGAPKVYIALERGQELWGNRFGNLTTIIVPVKDYNKELISQKIAESVDPFRLEYLVTPVREQGLSAAKNGVDFGQLFAGMGFFIISAGILLTVLLLQFSLQQRQNQWKLFASLGFNKKIMMQIIMTEASFIILLSVILGAIISIIYSGLVFRALNEIWFDIVRTDVLILHFNPWLILMGMLASLLTGIIVVYWGVKKSIKKHTDLQTSLSQTKIKNRHSSIIRYIALIFSIVTLMIIIFAFAGKQGNALFNWFAAGTSLLIAFLFWMANLLYNPSIKFKNGFSSTRLSLLNLIRNPLRSFTIVALLALGAFVIIATTANRKDMAIDSTDKQGGTGGFCYIAETTVPILSNLNETAMRLDLDLPEDIRFVQFLSAYDDDASCHNLNRVANPRIIATHTELLSGRFTFVSKHPLLDENSPWLSLKKDLHGGLIPAVADQTVMQWGLGKSIGDTLTYTNALGEKLHLLLIGGLNNSVLQGNVIIDVKHFAKNFPANDGASLFLIENMQTEIDISTDDLQFAFQDYGWEMTPTNVKLAAFNTIENTYMRIFFLMGALGILLGTVGLAVVIAKSMLDRKHETRLFYAIGYRRMFIFSIYFKEYLILFLVGILGGIIPALVVSMPVYLAGFHNISQIGRAHV